MRHLARAIIYLAWLAIAVVLFAGKHPVFGTLALVNAIVTPVLIINGKD